MSRRVDKLTSERVNKLFDRVVESKYCFNSIHFQVDE